MKKRIGTAILSIFIFCLILQPVYAADNRIDVVAAYVMDKEAQVFLDVPDTYDPTTFEVSWKDRESGSTFTMNPISRSGKCAHYLFLVEHSAKMEKSADTASAFIKGIDNKEKLMKDFNLCFYGSDGLEPMVSGTAEQLSDKLEEAEYRGKSANPYDAVLQAYDEIKRFKVTAGDPVYIFLICSGESYSDGAEHSGQAKKAIASHREAMFGNLCVDGWKSEEDAKTFAPLETQKHYIAGDNKTARECGEEFALWTQNSLSQISIMLTDDELEKAKNGKLDINLSFEGGQTYPMGENVAQDVPKQGVAWIKDVGFLEAESADPGDAGAGDERPVPDDKPVSGNEAVSDNDAVPDNSVVSDNAAVSENSVSENTVSDNSASQNSPFGKRDRDHDDGEEEEEEGEGLPGFVLPLAIGGGVVLILIVVVIILLMKGKKNRPDPGQNPNMPVNYAPDEILPTEKPQGVGPTVALSSAVHTRPSNVDRAEDALLAMTIEVYAGHCMRSSAVIYLHDLISFGSDNICDVLFRDGGVEAEHLRVSFSEGRVIVEDLSVGGVYVNGMRIQSRNPLRSGDVIGMGEAEFALKWKV